MVLVINKKALLITRSEGLSMMFNDQEFWIPSASTIIELFNTSITPPLI
jgi:hypothetical protein